MTPVRFMGDSRAVLRQLPDEVKSEIGFALERVQQGKMPVNAKPLKGIAPGVQEIKSDSKSGTFRAVYMARFQRAVYVLHVFQKKSKWGIATPKAEIDLVRRRLAQAVEWEAEEERSTMKKPYAQGSGNIYADLGMGNPQEAQAKADLAHRIVDIIEGHKLTQVQAAKVLGVDQPKVSALMRGRLTDFSIERLLRFLLLLGHDVHIAVTARPRASRRHPTLRVHAGPGRFRVAAGGGR